MNYIQTTATKKLKKLTKRIRGVAGGTGASKTVSIALLWIDKYQTLPNRMGSIVSESVPHLRRGVMRDFLNIMRSHGYYKEELWNRTDSIYTFETGSQIEFFAADQADKLRGGRRDDLWVNEANNVRFNAFNELEIRTRDTIWLDWNPTTSFWWYEEVLPHQDVDFITLTYKDNEALEQSIIDSIESRRESNPAWYKVYGLGQLGTLEGLIYQNWEIIDEVPEDARLERRGLDFGFTNDPSALIGIYRWNQGFVLDEELYAKGINNHPLANLIQDMPDPETLIVADSEDSKAIDTLTQEGLSVIGASKGGGSVRAGIDIVQDQKLYITKQSVNLIKDFRNYQWKVDRSGKPLNVPEHEFSHGPDAVRYAITDILGQTVFTTEDFVL